MNGPHLHPDTVAECIKAAHDYHPACYCVFSWLYAEPPPGRKYLSGTRWLQVNAWWAMGDKANDKHLLVVQAASGPELLRNLRGALAGLGPTTGPPQVPAQQPARFQPRSQPRRIGFRTAAQRAAEGPP